MSTSIQRAFVGGELAPALHARVDQQKYAYGVKVGRGFTIEKGGGLRSRPGTVFVAELKTSSIANRLIPFVFNDDQSYVLDFQNLTMRPVKSGAQLFDLTLTITGITLASPGTFSYTGTDTGLVNGDEIYISSVDGATIATFLNGRNFKAANVNVGANTLTLTDMNGTAINTTNFGAWVSGGTMKRVYTATHTYTTAQLAAIRYSQSADVMPLAHQSHHLANLTRSSDTSWTFADMSFGTDIDAPANVLSDGATGIGASYKNSWIVTAVKEDNPTESIGSTETSRTTDADLTAGTVISWDAVVGASSYRVYRKYHYVISGTTYEGTGFVQEVAALTFTDDSDLYTPDYTVGPPTSTVLPFATDFPKCVGYSQQRLIFANTPLYSENCRASRVGDFYNFNTRFPTPDDDPMDFDLTGIGNKVNQIQHILDFTKLIMFTSNGIVSVEGDSNGTLIPDTPNPKMNTRSAIGELAPLPVGDTVLFVQARGSIIRDCFFEHESNGFRGTDLTVFSTHLFKGYTIVSWAYQENPNSVIWCVRSDGTLLSLTYLREHNIWGWTRHDMLDATVEQVCCIPEGTEDAVYLTVKRTVNGRTVRYVERMADRDESDIVDYIGLDCSLTFDGRNATAHTMILSGSGWTYEDTLTATASAATFTAADVGKEIHLFDSDDEIIRFAIETYVSSTVVTGRPHKTVPATLQAVAADSWGLAVKTVTGLWHLEGEEISALGDGFVIANALIDETPVTVTNGQATFAQAHMTIHVGKSFICDIETLDLESVDGETMIDKPKNISAVTVDLEKTRGLYVGPKNPDENPLNTEADYLYGLQELKVRESESQEDPIDLKTEPVTVTIDPEWNSNGRVFLRLLDPLPATVLSIAPAGLIPRSR